jgi:AcrR family transcriptional regulator
MTGQSVMSRSPDPLAKVTLLRAAEEIFSERGLAHAKVEDIAKRAGVSKGAFYLHFDSKEAALKEVVESFLARTQSLVARPSDYPDVPDDPEGALEFGLERDVQIYEFLWQNKAFLRILGSCRGSGTYDYLVDAFREEIDRKNREWVALWKGYELFSADLDVDLAVVVLAGAYDALAARLVAAETRPPIQVWLHFAQTTFVRAWGTPALRQALEHRDRRVNITVRRPKRSSRNGVRS